MKMVSRGIRPIRSSGKNRKSSPTQNCPVFQLLQSAGAHNACLLNAFRVSGRFCSYMRSTISMRLTRSKARTDSPVNIVHRSAHPRDSTPPQRLAAQLLLEHQRSRTSTQHQDRIEGALLDHHAAQCDRPIGTQHDVIGLAARATLFSKHISFWRARSRRT